MSGDVVPPPRRHPDDERQVPRQSEVGCAMLGATLLALCAAACVWAGVALWAALFPEHPDGPDGMTAAGAAMALGPFTLVSIGTGAAAWIGLRSRALDRLPRILVRVARVVAALAVVVPPALWVVVLRRG